MGNPEITEQHDDRPGYRRFAVSVGERRFGVLWCPVQGDEHGRTLLSPEVGDKLWAKHNILSLEGHVSALACVDMIRQAYMMAGKADAAGYARRAAEIRDALGVRS